MKEIPSEERYILLAQKWLNGTITPEEEVEYTQWYNRFSDEDVLEIPANRAANREEYRQLILNRINQKRNKVVRLPYWYAAAAVVLLLAGAGIYGLLKPGSPEQAQLAVIPANTIDINPGIDGAILTTEDGKKIVLDTVSNGQVQLGAAVAARKQQAGFVFAANSSTAPVTQYTLTTPRARQQQITLPDGTQLWLNAMSGVKFPDKFTGKNRTIEVWGEVYLEVAENARQPFIVKANKMDVEVLGTHFNIMAYDNESAIRTTLLEGAVRLSSAQGKLRLQPGEQSVYTHNEAFKVLKDVNTEAVVAWKNGIQSFDETDIRTILRQVERWYDVEISYVGDIPNITFSGDIPRTAKLSQVLQLLSASKLNFEIDKNMKRIIVKP